MNLKKNIHEIASIHFGANTSAKAYGEVPCVQGRDFNSDGVYIAPEPQFAEESALKYTKYLQDGDVLFSSKGKFFATVWQGQIPNAIATGTFMILKVNEGIILPEYLALYLNSPKAKKFYEQNTKAATVQHIGKKQLDLFEIEIPPMKKQEALVKAHELLLEEKRLAAELFTRKEKIINYLI